jgi:hypothetical protein
MITAWRGNRSSARTLLPFALVLCLSAAAPASCRAQTSPIKTDEEVLFFPGLAVQAGTVWTAHVHGWIFEPQANRATLATLKTLLREKLDLPKEDFDSLCLRLQRGAACEAGGMMAWGRGRRRGGAGARGR